MADNYKHVEIALKYQGYLEKIDNNPKYLDDFTANAGYNNYTRFARDYDALYKAKWGAKQSYAWCAVFVCMSLIEAYGKAAAEKLCVNGEGLTAQCSYNWNSFKKIGKADKLNPVIGDIIIFVEDGRPCHTGIVYNLDSTKVYTIEGNTSSASGVVPNGGAVRAKSYALNSSYILGYLHLDHTYLAELNKDKEITKIPVKEEPVKMTQDQFNDMLLTSLKWLGTKPGSAWSEEDRNWATSNKLINGDESGNLMWQGLLTREQFASVLHRALKNLNSLT